jgi:lysophospholipase L1-like esterase
MKYTFFLFFLLFFHSILFSQGLAISPCAQLTDLHVVVIGSSTAAGTGPSSPDSAWVNRYRKYLQAINPLNQVTNLAIGGTTTYHIMPNWFTAPSGRPATNPSNNVTEAINLGADAIIVNMPSNDAANNFDLNEQMFNFITIFNSADSAGIPVWICTPQPRNFSAAQKAIQLSVRDSVFSYFGNYAIDFWTNMADTNHDILAQYNSGDGVHLNDAGHFILNNLVIGENIPNLLADTAAVTDHILVDLYLGNTSICGDSNTIVYSIIGNIGPSSLSPADINFTLTDNGTLIPTNNLLSFSNTLGTCSIDTISFIVNTYNAVDLSIQTSIINSDLDKSNDTSSIITLLTLGHPDILGFNDTICLGDSTTLSAQGSSLADTVLWYDAPIGGNIIAFGNDLSLNNVLSSQTYYPEAVRGNLYFEHSLATSTNTTTNWNGMMFDIVASDTITIDSLATKMNSLGLQNVVAYLRTGSHIGYENNNTAWTLWGTNTTSVNAVGELKVLDYPDIFLQPNDTLGIYLHLQNSASTLSYLNTGTGLVYSNSQLEILPGTGISYTFGTTYNPRNWCGEVFYHHGFNPTGHCNSPRTPVSAIVSEPNIQLGNDTTLYLGQSVLLNSGSFDSYLWSNSNTGSQLLVDTSNFNLGANSIWLSTTNEHGCIASDTIVINFSTNTNLVEIESPSIQMIPNPSNGQVQLKGVSKNCMISIVDINGTLVKKYAPAESSLDLSELPKGIYFIVFSMNKKQVTRKLVLY